MVIILHKLLIPVPVHIMYAVYTMICMLFQVARPGRICSAEPPRGPPCTVSVYVTSGVPCDKG